MGSIDLIDVSQLYNKVSQLGLLKFVLNTPKQPMFFETHAQELSTT